MSVTLNGVRAITQLRAKNYWMSQAAREFDCLVLSTPFQAKAERDSCEVNVVFVGIRDPETVKSFFSRLNNFDVIAMTNSDSGIVTELKCKGKNTLDYQMSRLPGRIGIVANPNQDELRVTIDSLEQMGPGNLIETFKLASGITIAAKPVVEKTLIPLEEFINFNFDVANLDAKDRKLAKELLDSGYYEVPRPKGLTLTILGSRIGLSKPTLISRIRRLENLGIKRVLGGEKISEEGEEAALLVFKETLKRRPK